VRLGHGLGAENEMADRLPPAVEAAAYFVLSEALSNVAKHPHAQCSVRDPDA